MVGAGVWKLLLSRSPKLCEIVAQFCSAVVQSGIWPSAGKRSVIVPIPKKAWGGRGLDNIRPITLQSALCKLISKVLARRLTEGLVRNKLLHPSQQAFLPSGDMHRCVDTLILAWRRNRNQSSYSLFYDIQKAYDSVRHDDIIASLRRLCLPEAYVDLVRDQLADMQCRVRTAYGDTDWLCVERGVPQGGPESPAWFIIAFDPLLCRLSKQTPPSFGLPLAGSSVDVVHCAAFADDLTILSRSMDGIRHLHSLAEEYCRAAHWRFNGKKSKLAGQAKGRRIDCDLEIDGHPIASLAPQEPVSYLGACLQVDGKWAEASSTASRIVKRFSDSVRGSRPRLSVSSAVFVWNVMMLPKLEHILRVADVDRKTLHKWDKWVLGVVADMGWRDWQRDALASLTGLVLPSMLEVRARLLSVFARLNEPGAVGNAARELWKGEKRVRGFARSDLWSSVGLSLRPSLPLTSLGRGDHITLELPCARSDPSADWPTGPFKLPIGVYTSHCLGLPALPQHRHLDVWCAGGGVAGVLVGWACLPDCLWLDRACRDSNRDQGPRAPSWTFDRAALEGSPLISGFVEPSDGACSPYEAHLRAILEAVACVPSHWSIRVFCPSQSAIAAVQHHLRLAVMGCVRRQCRMAGRPILHLIGRCVADRRGFGNSTTTFHFCSPAEDSADRSSVATRLVRWAAVSARRSPADTFPQPHAVNGLPLACGDPFVTVCDPHRVVVSSDLRRYCARRQQCDSVSSWRQSRSQGCFVDMVDGLDSPPGMAPDVFAAQVVDQWRRAVLGSDGFGGLGLNPHIADFAIRLLTNTLHFVVQDSRRHAITCVHCSPAGSVRPVFFDVFHLFQCPSPTLDAARTAALCWIADQFDPPSPPSQDSEAAPAGGRRRRRRNHTRSGSVQVFDAAGLGIADHLDAPHVGDFIRIFSDLGFITVTPWPADQVSVHRAKGRVTLSEEKWRLHRRIAAAVGLFSGHRAASAFRSWGWRRKKVGPVADRDDPHYNRLSRLASSVWPPDIDVDVAAPGADYHYKVADEVNGLRRWCVAVAHYLWQVSEPQHRTHVYDSLNSIS
jgi:hypothetical protein